jgi:hypothetical protein
MVNQIVITFSIKLGKFFRPLRLALSTHTKLDTTRCSGHEDEPPAGTEIGDRKTLPADKPGRKIPRRRKEK